ncbi:MAG: bifunctional glutamine synthetase adenylyltransferase/deadenyltransferase, partial [Enterobacterales bacterium]|nr:bifunctional glutamine synthetase adenylyltransferase/deadenyltransferase [Enterobacterales bacterium]
RMDVLREFKQTHLLRLSAALCSNAIDVVQLGRSLSSLAETIIDEACVMAWQTLSLKYGQPEVDDTEGAITPGFGVVAYGKLGGQEMSFNSDLDLVFIYSAVDGQTNGVKSIDTRSFYVRLAQKIIHILSVRTRTGVLYEVDMRLRPSGNSGLLVSHIEAFADYQNNDAWTWEHQALIRARCIQASSLLANKFEHIRTKVLTAERDIKLLTDVKAMRKRMRDHLLKTSRDKHQFDLKQGIGGIADIEFLVQFWVLKYASKMPDLINRTQCLTLLKALEKVPELSNMPLGDLAEHYACLQEKVNYLALQKLPAMATITELNAEAITQVERLWLDVFGPEHELD